jgi:hypothetical protein
MDSILVLHLWPVSVTAELGISPFAVECDRIKQAVNEGDSEALYKLSSMWFQKFISFDEFSEEFKAEDRHIEQLIALYSLIGPDVATVVVKMGYREQGGGLISGLAVVYFDREGDEWKFNTIPFSRRLNALCSAHLPSPLKNGFYNSE